MGAGTPVVLRSGPRPRHAEEAVLLIGGDKGNLMGAPGPDPETREERENEQRPGRAHEQDLNSSGFGACRFVSGFGLFSLVLHTASPASPLRPTSRAVDRA